MTGSDSDLSDQDQAPIQGLHGFVEYFPGNTNVIVSVPHGGEMRPPFILDRVKKVGVNELIVLTNKSPRFVDDI